jgi:transposase
VIDLLPDRTAETLATWLRQHPEVEIVSRDRGGAFAEGARQGAPQAVQVADRFHLLKNVTDSLERFLARQHAGLRQAAQAVTAQTQGEAPVGAPPEAACAPSPPVAPPRPRRLTRHEQDHENQNLITRLFVSIVASCSGICPFQESRRRESAGAPTLQRYHSYPSHEAEFVIYD